MVQKQREVRFVGTESGLQIANTSANYQDSMSILAANGLIPLTYQNALAHAPELIKELKGNWFYLAGAGIGQNGLYTFNDKGELQPLKGNEKSEQTVRVWSGKNPLSLVVDYASYVRRFILDADRMPGIVASVVVGIKASSEGAVELGQRGAVQVLQSELSELKRAQEEKRELSYKLESEAQQLKKESGALDKEIEKRIKALAKLQRE